MTDPTQNTEDDKIILSTKTSNLDKVDLNKIQEYQNTSAVEEQKLKPEAKAQYKLTAWVLFFSFVLFVASAAAHIMMPINEAAANVFEFCKSFIPPIITLVLGAHYVNKNSENGNGTD